MKKIKIRKIDDSDTNSILKWRNSQHVMNVFIDRNPLTEQTHLLWLENYVKTGKVAQYIAYDEDNKVDFGSVYLRDIDHKNKKAEFGIFIGEKEYIGRGVGSEITRQLVNKGFNELGLNRIYARILKYNDASYNMFIKLGFKKDAVLREDVIINDEPVDVYIVSILKEEWNKNEL